ncbi:MAG TPA: hypothetical protein VHV51_26050 [Polyangiaceae bacterium]|nr:hypothetical protein [Polyangiaceae bacterium]
MPSHSTKRLRPRWLSLPIALLIVTSAGIAWADDVPISDSARQHFQAGVNLLQDPDGARYAEAYREFQMAYSDSPSWKILSNLGIAALKLERDGEAADAFAKYLAEGGSNIDEAERAQVERDLQTLRAGLVKFTLQSDPPGAIITDERVPPSGATVVNRYGPLSAALELGVRGGHHRMTASLSGYKDSVWEFDTPGQGDAHTFTLEKLEAAPVGTPGTEPGTTPPTMAPKRPVPPGVFVGVAVTGALAAGGAVVGVLALGKKSDFNTANSSITDAASQQHAQSLHDSGQKLNLVADGLFGGAIVAGIVTTVLFVTRPTHQEQPAATTLRLSPAVASNGGGLFLSGTFH